MCIEVCVDLAVRTRVKEGCECVCVVLDVRVLFSKGQGSKQTSTLLTHDIISYTYTKSSSGKTDVAGLHRYMYFNARWLSVELFPFHDS